MNLTSAIISAAAMAVAPPQASLGQPAGLGAVGSVARLIRNRRGPSASLRRTGLASLVALMLLAPSQGSAQVLQSFEDLALRVNLNDQLRVDDRSGVGTIGRLTRLTAEEITLQTAAGEKHFTRETVRQVAVRHQPLRMSVLIGAGAGAVSGAVAACTGPDREECADAPIMAGALGAGLGLAVGALIHKTPIVYPEAEKRTLVLPVISRDAVGVRVSLYW